MNHAPEHHSPTFRLWITQFLVGWERIKCIICDSRIHDNNQRPIALLFLLSNLTVLQLKPHAQQALVRCQIAKQNEQNYWTLAIMQCSRIFVGPESCGWDMLEHRRLDERGRYETISSTLSTLQQRYKSLSFSWIDQFSVSNCAPFTWSSVENSATPAAFDAIHLKMPRCLPPIGSMLSEDSRGDIRTTANPFSPFMINCPFSDHFMSSGRSPLVIMHCRALLSPGFAGSSPNENGDICGATGYLMDIGWVYTIID